jgi:opacity protein-like surface antigen
MGWAGTAEVPVAEEEAQGHGERIDEWGVGFSGGAGYEFWMSSNFTAGLGVGFNYFDIGADIVDRAAFGVTLLNLNLYF